MLTINMNDYILFSMVYVDQEKCVICFRGKRDRIQTIRQILNQMGF
jgi:hypothetical protein